LCRISITAKLLTRCSGGRACRWADDGGQVAVGGGAGNSLSAQRFRGAEGAKPGSVRYEQGIQQREDALHRLVDIWATGEAAASMGFAAARLFDELDPLEKQKTAMLKERGIGGGRAEMKALRESEERAIELTKLRVNSARRRSSKLIRWSSTC